MAQVDTTPLRDFITATTELLSSRPHEAEALDGVRPLLGRLVARDGWLHEELAAPGRSHYRPYLLHADPQGLFPVLGFVRGPGQGTPVHDHTVWGLIGLLRGQEPSQAYTRNAQGRLLPQGPPLRLSPGQVEAVSPRIGDIHRVANAYDGRVSISIHVDGAHIGTVQRHVFADDGSVLWGAA